MIVHVVLFKLKERTPDTIEEVANLLRPLPDLVPGIDSFEVGIDDLRTTRSWDIALRATFPSWEAYRAYDEHPRHTEIKVQIKERAASAAAVDFET